MRTLMLSLACLWLLSPLAAGNDAEVRAIYEQVQVILVAVEKRDSAGILDHAHPKLIEAAGGRAVMETALREAFEQWAKLGMKIKTTEFPSPPSFYKGAVNEFVIIPTHTVIAIVDKSVSSSGYQLGVRKIGETRWGYVDGATLTREQALLLFPDLPKNLKLPEVVNKIDG
jgi:hypothetical protein